MIITEYHSTRKDGAKLFRTYSNANVHIRKIGTDEIYSEAVDIEGSGYTYEETDIPIETGESAEIESEETNN